MKIISSKKYEEIKQELTNLNLDIQDRDSQIDLYNQQTEYLMKELKDYEMVKKEVKRLKGLLTKNGISYKKVEKNGKRN